MGSTRHYAKLWVNKKYSGIAGRITNNPLYVAKELPIDGRPITDTVANGANLNVENAFCYLGDMLSFGVGYGQAIKTRCSVFWVKFRKFLPLVSALPCCMVVRPGLQMFQTFYVSAAMIKPWFDGYATPNYLKRSISNKSAPQKT